MKLIKVMNNCYKLVGRGFSVEGNLGFVVDLMRTREGVPQDDIELALNEMRATGDSVAAFDETTGEFTHTMNDFEWRMVVAELSALHAVKIELVRLHEAKGDARATRDCYDRLVTLATTLNVEAVLRCVGTECMPVEMQAA